LLGIIGGIGPESTIEYYRQILALYRQRRPDGNSPPLIINSINNPAMLALAARGAEDELTDLLLREIERLRGAGATFGLLAANTPHLVFDRLAARSPIPLLSIVEATCAAAQAQGLRRVGLFGTRFTMQGTFYPRVFEREGVELVLPSPPEQEFIHDRYMNELLANQFLPATRERMFEIAERMRVEEGIAGLILGGTELPLLLSDTSGRGMAFLDTTRIHVESAVTKMLE
jgi:aspartate racemase